MISRRSQALRGARGFTLVEVMVAITILLLVILPLASLYIRSLTAIQNAALYSQAIQLGQERMELCKGLRYGSLYYYNEVLTPGFPYVECEGAYPPHAQRYDYFGDDMFCVLTWAYDCRDNPDTDWVETYFDPTDWLNRHYPVPVYRDYYNNYTGLCLDPNFNGLCDDDLDGDGEPGMLAYGGTGVDMEDIEIATNGRLLTYTDVYGGTGLPAENLGDIYIPGDGLWDTVVEGAYVSSMDPMWRQVRITESISPILDLGLLLDRAHESAYGDYRHREKTYRNFVRMTTFIDPTPMLGNPNDVDTWVDQLYIRNMGYTGAQVIKLLMCLERDLPLQAGMTNYDVGVDEAGLVEMDAFSANYHPPIYGTKVIVTVFYLTGEGEVELVDLDGDGVYEEVPMETYGGARQVRLERMFYNSGNINASSKSYPPPRRYLLSTAGTPENPARALTLPDVEDGGDGSDPCDLDHDGLPYLAP